MERDLRYILAIQALRAFAYGFGSVLLGSILAGSGLSDAEVGLIFTGMLAGAAAATLGVARRGERLGRRRTYAILLGIMGIAGAAFALSTWVPLLLLACLTGTLSTDPNESGPITSVEQAMLGESAPALRAKIFGRYNAVAYLAGSLGALAAGGPDALRSIFPALPPDQRWLLVFPAVAVASVVLARRLSAAVEATDREIAEARQRTPLTESRGVVRKLAGLFALDSFAGGFIVQAFLVFWFQRTFGVNTQVMGLVFFAAGLLQAASSVVSGWLAGRVGMLNTMVFTHLPSNVVLMAVPFMPTLALAIALLLVRFALSQMDVPARQAYINELVEPHERTAAAGYTNTARYVARPAGPLLASSLMAVWPAAPFLVAGGLKAAYDLSMFAVFRRVPLKERGSAGPTA